MSDDEDRARIQAIADADRRATERSLVEQFARADRAAAREQAVTDAAGIQMVDRMGRTVSIADPEEARARYEAGELGFEGDTVPIALESGEVRTVRNDPAEIRAAFGAQRRIAAAGELAGERLRSEESDRPIRAGAEGFARGFTGGLSDIAGMVETPDQAAAAYAFLRNRGLYPEMELGGGLATSLEELRDNARRMQARQENNETAATVGELGGMVAGAITGQGPAGAASRTGLLAEGVVTRTLAREAAGGFRNAAARTLGRAVGGALEGGATEGMRFFTDSALGRQDLTAEGFYAAMGAGSLWGGGGTAGLGAIGDALGVATRATGQGARRLARQSREALSSMFERQNGVRARPGVVDAAIDAYSRAAETATGTGRGEVRRFLDLSPEGQRLRQNATRADEVFDSATREGRQILDSVDRDARAVFDEAIGRHKADDVLAATRELADQSRAAAAALERLTFIRAQTDEMLTDAATWGSRGSVRRIAADAETVTNRIREIAASGEDVAGRTFLEMDQFKRRLGRDARPGRMLNSEADADALARIRSWYDGDTESGVLGVRQLLEDEGVFGRAGTMQRETNAAWHEYLSTARKYNELFTERIGQEGFNPIFTHSPAKLDSYLRNLGSARNELGEEVLRRHVAARERLAGVIGQNFDLSPEARAALGRATETNGRLRTFLERTSEDVAGINQYRVLERNARESSQIMGASLGATAGGVLLGPAGAGLGGAIGSAVSRPDQIVRVLATLERLGQATDNRLTRAVRGWLAKERPLAIRPVTRGPSRRVARRATPALSIEAMRERVRELRSFATEKSKQAKRLDDSTAAISAAAPTIAGLVQGRARAAAEFLASKIPEGLGTSSALRADRSLSSVPDSEARRWLEYARAVENPMAVLDDLERGQVTPEGIETLRVVTPTLFAELQRRVQQELSTREEPLPYETELQLGLLFDLTTVPSLEPQSIATLQGLYAASPTPEQAEQAQTAPPQTSRRTDISRAFMTETERVANRSRA